jgi:hypothetical protein
MVQSGSVMPYCAIIRSALRAWTADALLRRSEMKPSYGVTPDLSIDTIARL